MRSLILSLLLFSFSRTFAQDTLTLEKAIRIALENNNLIKVSRTEQVIAQKDVTLGNAGFLPLVNLTATSTRASNDIRQELSTGNIITRDNARASSIAASTGFSWLLFDGFRRINAYTRLLETYTRAVAQNNVTVENTISNVSGAYFGLVREKEIEAAYQNNLVLYQERLRLAEAKMASGLGSKSDVLQTRVDINTQKSILLRQQLLIENAAVTLNQVLNREVSAPVLVSMQETRPIIDTNTAFTGRSNALIVTEKDIEIARKQLQELNADFLPQLSIIAAYNYTRNQSQAGLTLLNRSTGPSIGLSLNWNIFNGFNKTRVRRAGLMRIDAARFLHEENRLNQLAAYQKALQQFKISNKILLLEQESYQLARESSEIARQRYQAGSISLFEYKETQLALEASKIRLANARYETVATETEINRLNSQLIRQ